MSRSTMRMLAILAVLVVYPTLGTAQSATPAQGGRIAPPCQTVSACHQALAWHRKHERDLTIRLDHKERRDARYALRLAAAMTGEPYPNLVCIGWHESGLGAQKYPEPGSGAKGLMQFLDSTWAHTPFAAAGFSVMDDVPDALAAVQIMVHDGSARQWTTGAGCGL